MGTEEAIGKPASSCEISALLRFDSHAARHGLGQLGETDSSDVLLDMRRRPPCDHEEITGVFAKIHFPNHIHWSK
jgi:hypothetical protein